MQQNNEFSTMLALQNTLGWHMRPAGLLVGIANMFESEIMVKCGWRIASAKSLLGILSLGAGRGARIYISARGRDAQLAIQAIKEKFSADPRTCGFLQPGDVKGPDEGKFRVKDESLTEAMVETKRTLPQGRVTTTFKFGAKPDAKDVFLAGDFNAWDPQAEPMIRKGVLFSKCVKLMPGKYQYKYVVDGEWHLDPVAPLEVSRCGSTNNVIYV